MTRKSTEGVRASDLANMRSELTTVTHSNVRVRFEVDVDGTLVPVLECVACGEILQQAPTPRDRTGFVCPDCGMDVSSREAITIVDHTLSLLTTLRLALAPSLPVVRRVSWLSRIFSRIVGGSRKAG